MGFDYRRHALARGLCVLALAGAPVVTAQSPSAGGADYVTGGITESEADELRQRASSFPLQVQFARSTAEGNAFAADVQVRVIDAGGRTVLEVPSADPILLANVPPGRYTVEATFQGQTKRQTVNVGRGHANITLVWQ